MTTYAILCGLSVCFQLAAMFVALRLIVVVRERIIGVLIFITGFLMAVRRFLLLHRLAEGVKITDDFTEFLGLLISVLFFFGVLYIAKLFRSLRETDASRQESEKRYRTLADASFEGIIVSYQGIIIDANQRAGDLLGHELSDIVGQDILTLIAPEDREFVRNSLRSRRAEPFEHGLIRKDASLITVETRARIFEREEKVYTVTVMRDITDRKLAEHRLQERTRQLEFANRELESFTYSASHDLRAPLRAIDGYSRMLLRKYGERLNEDAMNRLYSIRANTQKMGQLIEDLLSLAGATRKGMNTAVIDMKALAAEVWEEVREANQERELQVRITELPHGYGDRTLIKQVLVNLLSNAVKFTRDRKPAVIELGSSREGSERIYYIRDNGVGFDMKYHDKLFGSFQRLHQKDEYDGTGIGLAIVQRIVQRHGGRVWAEGEIDRGATFYFTLLKGNGTIRSSEKPPVIPSSSTT